MKILFIVGILCFFNSCEYPKNNKAFDEKSMDALMPSNQKKFLSRFTKLSLEYNSYSNAYQRNSAVEKFEKFVKDTIKKAENWIMIVDNINDSPYKEARFAKMMYGASKDLYNLQMYSGVSKDSILADTSTGPLKDKWHFIYSVIKKPTKHPSVEILEVLKKLKTGDTILVTGYPTALGLNGKIDYTTLIGAGHLNDAFDFLLEDIRVKK
jgi:hypothetical protein